MTENDRLTAGDTEYRLGQLPCRCGEIPRVKSLQNDKFKYYYYVQCAVCKRARGLYPTIKGAIKRWNSYVSSLNPVAGG